jgi:stalled ribosome alternative rescue factor ArfA
MLGILHDFRIFLIGKGSFQRNLRKVRKNPSEYTGTFINFET